MPKTPKSRSRSRSRSKSAAKIPPLNSIFPPGTRWGNTEAAVANEPAPKGAKGVYVPPHARRAADAAGATEGNLRTRDGVVQIFTTKPVIRANGTVIRDGAWVRAVDPEGDYGGPYDDLRDLLDNRRFQEDMANIGLDQARFRTGPPRSRSRSRSRRGRSRSRGRGRSRSRSASRRGRGGAGASRSRSRSYRRSRSRNYTRRR